MRGGGGILGENHDSGQKTLIKIQNHDYKVRVIVRILRLIFMSELFYASLEQVS